MTQRHAPLRRGGLRLPSIASKGCLPGRKTGLVTADGGGVATTAMKARARREVMMSRLGLG